MTKCTLSDNELISESFKWIKKLADTGGTAWTLKVPVDFNNDPDILFCELGNRLKDKDHQLSAEREKAAKLVEAATAVMESWSERMNGEIEEEKENKFGPYKYWSPSASMVDSKAISQLRQSLTEYKKQ